MSALLDCALASWSPRIGDPTVMGWVTVAAYAGAAIMALVVLRRLPAGRTERVFWAGAAVFLAGLGVNKQLDLQSFLTAIGRCHAKTQGWYDARQAVQVSFILGLVAATASVGFVLAWLLRRTWRRTGLAAAGLFLIAGFVLVRAVGFHHVDALIGMRFAGARMNWILELGGIAVFAAGCLPALRGRSRRQGRC